MTWKQPARQAYRFLFLGSVVANLAYLSRSVTETIGKNDHSFGMIAGQLSWLMAIPMVFGSIHYYRSYETLAEIEAGDGGNTGKTLAWWIDSPLELTLRYVAVGAFLFAFAKATSFFQALKEMTTFFGIDVATSLVEYFLSESHKMDMFFVSGIVASVALLGWTAAVSLKKPKDEKVPEDMHLWSVTDGFAVAFWLGAYLVLKWARFDLVVITGVIGVLYGLLVGWRFFLRGQDGSVVLKRVVFTCATLVVLAYLRT